MMQRHTVLGLTLATLLLASAIYAQDAPPDEQAQPGHEWLKQFVGQWQGESDLTMTPGEAPMKVSGTETARMLGDFWVISDYETTVGEMKITAVMTLGYDPDKKKYIGTWVDSISTHLWKLEGTVSEDGKTLTLLAEGPNPAAPDGVSMFKDVIEFRSPDHKVLTSSIQTADGTWQTFSVGNYRKQ